MSFDALDISASALYAQRVKMDTVASNIANVNTTRNPDGTPGTYRRKEVIFSTVYKKALEQNNSSSENSGSADASLPETGSIDMNALLGETVNANSTVPVEGVTVNQIVNDNSPLRREYNPSHPDADKDGYVSLPNVNIVTEMVDMISASRAYEANITTLDTTKGILTSALRI